MAMDGTNSVLSQDPLVVFCFVFLGNLPACLHHTIYPGCSRTWTESGKVFAFGLKAGHFSLVGA
jgi:hypothetical protein